MALSLPKWRVPCWNWSDRPREGATLPRAAGPFPTTFRTVGVSACGAASFTAASDVGATRPRTTELVQKYQETIELIRKMARANRLWRAERIRGELLKLGVRVSKRTIQKYLTTSRRRRPPGQRWATLPANHARDIWACDFVQTCDVWFRPIFAFLVINVSTREVVHAAVTRSPTSVWTAQQLRNVTPFGEGPRFIIRDRDDKFGDEFDRAAAAVSARVIRTAVRASNMNAICKRFIGSVRRDCLDHVIILNECHLCSVLAEYIRYFNCARPHQALRQRTPTQRPQVAGDGAVQSLPVLGGLHHDYRSAA